VHVFKEQESEQWKDQMESNATCFYQ